MVANSFRRCWFLTFSHPSGSGLALADPFWKLPAWWHRFWRDCPSSDCFTPAQECQPCSAPPPPWPPPPPPPPTALQSWEVLTSGALTSQNLHSCLLTGGMYHIFRPCLDWYQLLCPFDMNYYAPQITKLVTTLLFSAMATQSAAMFQGQYFHLQSPHRGRYIKFVFCHISLQSCRLYVLNPIFVIIFKADFH